MNITIALFLSCQWCVIIMVYQARAKNHDIVDGLNILTTPTWAGKTLYYILSSVKMQNLICKKWARPSTETSYMQVLQGACNNPAFKFEDIQGPEENNFQVSCIT